MTDPVSERDPERDPSSQPLDPPADQPAEQAEDDERSAAELIARQVEDALAAGDAGSLLEALNGAHPADAAEAMRLLDPNVAHVAFSFLGEAFPLMVAIELPENLCDDVFEHFSAEKLGEALSELDTDDAAAIADRLAPEKLEAALASLDWVTRDQVAEALSFERYTAGRLMQREFVAAPVFWSVGQTIDHMRAMGEDLPDQFFELYLVDPGFKPKGAVPLHRLLRSPRNMFLRQIAEEIPVEITADMDQEEAARAFEKYDLVSAPVLDEDGRLKGMLTIDDMVDVLREENEDDMLKLGGVSETPAGAGSITQARARAPWLGVNLVTSMASAGVIALFDETIADYVALAILMPVVASLGGNAGLQALTVTVRNLALGLMQASGAGRRAVAGEILTALINGVVFSAGLALLALALFRDPMLSAVLGAALLINFLLGGLIGALAPLALKRLGVDPAVASSVMVTTASDIIGFFAFLGLASLFL